MIFISINTARRLISIDSRAAVADEWREDAHPRDGEGKFASTGGGKESKKEVAKTVKKARIKIRKRKGVSLSAREYGLLHHSLNEYIAGKDVEKGKILQWQTGEYCYRVLINDYNDYVPLTKRRIQ